MNYNLLLNDLKQKLEYEFNDLIEKVILFGSQINGKASEFSDYDILVVLKKDYDWKIEEKIIDLSYEVALKYDIIIDMKVISVNELNNLRGKQPYIINALKLQNIANYLDGLIKNSFIKKYLTKELKPITMILSNFLKNKLKICI